MLGEFIRVKIGDRNRRMVAMASEVKAEELMELGHKARLTGDMETAVQYFQQAADAGDHGAWYQMGYAYQQGSGVEQSYEKALMWFEKLLDAGDVDAWYLSGTVYEDMENYDKAVECYEKQIEEEGTCKYLAYYGLAKAYRYGWGKEVDIPLALDYYQRAAGNGEIEAMVELGEMYHEGQLVGKNDDIANYWFEKAANSYDGNYAAFCHLGMAYYWGTGKEEDYDKAEKYLIKALEAGEDNALYTLGMVYRDKEDYEKAMEYFLSAAVEGNEFQAEAETEIFELYRHGLGVEMDVEKAFEWCKKGAEHGDDHAMVALGYMYSNGEGVEEDVIQGAYWTLQAAKQGNSVAMYNIGDDYENGTGVEQDYVAAMAWYKRAAEAGVEDAMACIGDLYYFGNGVEQDYSLAKDWYERAVMAGDETPLMPLGTIYYYRQDYDKAMQFYLEAANDGNRYQHIAEARIGDLYMEGAGVEQDMSKYIEWYKKSAGHDYGTAMLNLGDAYRDGWGVETDIDEARNWYEKAMEAGEEEAEQRLAELK